MRHGVRSKGTEGGDGRLPDLDPDIVSTDTRVSAIDTSCRGMTPAAQRLAQDVNVRGFGDSSSMGVQRREFGQKTESVAVFFAERPSSDSAKKGRKLMQSQAWGRSG
jgi:hypothetical protein